MRKALNITFYFLLITNWLCAQTITGIVEDTKTLEPVIGANVVVKGTGNGTTTDVNGRFSLTLRPQTDFPITLQITFIGYTSREVEVSSAAQEVKVTLQEDAELLGEVSIIEQRLSEKQRESALTVEAMDAIAIKETPSVSFYEGLGNLKGVDLTSASIGFKIINTRGFNSTSPVRSLQIIDGVDNQAPGLNFSLGNFLGASELDVANVDIIAGASTAFYGPGAFNGVIAMTTKNPFDYQGISASVKVGERCFTETAVRYAEGFKFGKKEFENFAFKVNLYFLTANDWKATNYAPIDDSDVPADNPGGYDAVNIYGDEDLGGGNDYDNLLSVLSFPSYAGLGKFYRTGYREENLVDYDTRNLKTSLGLYYRVSPETQLSYNFNYGTGTTVYQGENRFSLNDIQFLQNTIELRKANKYFVKAYATHEDAGNSYDAVLTAFKMNEAIASNQDWNNAYTRLYRNTPLRYGDSTLALTGTPADFPALTPEQWFNGPYQDSLDKYNAQISSWHEFVRTNVDNGQFSRPEAGTAEFDSLFNYITSRTFTEGGSKFYDKSALYHIMGEYQFNPRWATVRVGGNFRLYAPDSRGNIFDEVDSIIIVRDANGLEIDRKFTYRKITNREFGVYMGAEKKLLTEQLKLNFTIRMDKNENFDYLFSPAISAVYDLNTNNTFRVSFSSAIRNPTLQDQYLNYNVGRAILKGNLNGYDSLVTLESFDHYRNQDFPDRDTLDYFNVPPIQPEKVKTLELGYRATLFKRMYVDMGYYYSWYTNFIGYQFGLDLTFPDPNSAIIQSLQAYRISANAEGLVTTRGFNLGANYYLTDELTINGNYSFNTINLLPENNFVNRAMYGENLNNIEETDPIIPAFNTPKNKFNLGFTGRGFKPFSGVNHKLGFSINYKWVEGFRFEGSPQFTGFIESYGLTDAQVSYQIPAVYCTFKLGAANIFNNKVFQVYGGPTIGRLAYFSIVFEKA